MMNGLRSKTSFLICIAFLCCCGAAEVSSMEFAPQSRSKESSDSSILEARIGYLWGVNQIRFRNGTVPSLAPEKRDLTMDSPIFGIQAGTFALSDLAVRGQFWINIPLSWGNGFFYTGKNQPLPTFNTWNVVARYMEADLAAIYHFRLSDMPYNAAVMAGYRFYKEDFNSNSFINSNDNMADHFQIHVPYIGVYYSHSNLVGMLTRLELLWSPIILSRLDGTRHFSTGNAGRYSVDGFSYFGQWADFMFELSKKFGDNALAGLFIKYNYINPAGQVTIDPMPPGTYTMDMRHHLCISGLTLTYAF